MPATLSSRPSRCATASESLSRACASESVLKIGRISAVLIATGVAQTVALQMRRAALPGAAEDLGDRRLQAAVRVGDRQLHTDQATRDEPAQEVGPKRLGLGVADVDREGLAPAVSWTPCAITSA
jgi:hypothetical protein